MEIAYPQVVKAIKENKMKDYTNPETGEKYKIRDWGILGDDFDNYFNNFLYGLNEAYDKVYQKKHNKTPYGDSIEEQPLKPLPDEANPDLESLKLQNFDRPEQVVAWLDKKYPGLSKEKKDAIIKEWWKW